MRTNASAFLSVYSPSFHLAGSSTGGERELPDRRRADAPIAHAPRRRDWPWAVAVNVWPWEVPEKIAWQAGLLSKKGSPAWRGTRLPDWHHKFCKGKHGPC